MARFGIIETNLSIVKGNEQSLVEGRPVDVGWIDAFAGDLGQVNFQGGCVGPLAVVFFLIHTDLGIVFNKGIGNGGKPLAASFGPANTSDRAPVGKLLDFFPRLCVP